MFFVKYYVITIVISILLTTSCNSIIFLSLSSRWFHLTSYWQFLNSAAKRGGKDSAQAASSSQYNNRVSALMNVYTVPPNWNQTPQDLQPLDTYLTDKHVITAMHSILDPPNWQSFAVDYPEEMNNFFHAPYSVNIQHQFNLSEPLEDSRSF
jgi:hypothetical protein